MLEAEADGKRNSELLSTAGSILGGLLGGRSRSGMLGKLGTAAGKHGRSNAARQRVDAAEGKVGRLHDDLVELESELAADVAEIDAKWTTPPPNAPPRSRSHLGQNPTSRSQPDPRLDAGW